MADRSASTASGTRWAPSHWAASRDTIRDTLAWLWPDVLAPFIFTRLALMLVAEVAAITIPRALTEGSAPPAQTAAWFAPFLTLDAEWYMRIAANWYQFDPTLEPRVQQSPVFFPLYPALVRIVNAGLGGGSGATLGAAALIVANMAALVGLTLLYRLVRRELGGPNAQRTVLYLLAFPVSFSLSSGYAEPLFLLACVWAVSAARADHWLAAGVAGAAAALTRPYGVLIVVPLGFELLRTRWPDVRRLIQLRLLWLGLPLVALGGWMVYLYTLSGDPLLFAHLQVAWDDQKLRSPLETILEGYGRTRDQQLQGRFDVGSLRFAAAVLGLIATAATWRALPWTYAAFATVFYATVMSSGSLVSIWRHLLLIFPLFMVAGRMGAWRAFDRAYLSLSLIGSGLMLVLLSTNWAMVS